MNTTANEIITICIGQCGIFGGNSYYSTIMNEHKIDKNGQFIGNLTDENDKLLLNKINTCFNHNNKTNQYIPRAIFIDIDNTSINKLKTSYLSSLMNTNNTMIHGKYSEPSIIYPNGYSNDGKDLIDYTMDKLRYQIEICDYYQGINMIHSIIGGFGSGFSTLLLTTLTDEYPKKIRLTNTIPPSISNSYYTWYHDSEKSKIYSHHNSTFSIYN
eukprot:390194_1